MAEVGAAAGITLYLDKCVAVFDYNCFDDRTVLEGKRAFDAGEAKPSGGYFEDRRSAGRPEETEVDRARPIGDRRVWSGRRHGANGDT